MGDSNSEEQRNEEAVVHPRVAFTRGELKAATLIVLQEKHCQSWPKFFYPISFGKEGERSKAAEEAAEWFVEEVIGVLGVMGVGVEDE